MNNTQGQSQDQQAPPPQGAQPAPPQHDATAPDYHGQQPAYAQPPQGEQTREQGQMPPAGQMQGQPQYMQPPQGQYVQQQGQMPPHMQGQMPYQGQYAQQGQQWAPYPDQQQWAQQAQYMQQVPPHMQGQVPPQHMQGQYPQAPQGYYHDPNAQYPQQGGQVPPPPDAPAPAEETPEYYGACNSFFNGLAKIGPFALLLILACIAWPIFFAPAKGVFCPAEVKSLSAFLACVAQNSWYAPVGLESGALNLPQWPVFSWWIGLFALIPQLVESGLLLPVATFTATFLAIFGVWALVLATRSGGRAAFAAGIILLCAPAFAPLPHFVGPAALAAALLIWALAFFCRGWQANNAWISLPLAFALTALAGLCGGILHFAVPLVASICFLIWRGSFRRAQKGDAIFGFILMLAILGAWFGLLMTDKAHDAYLNTLFADAWRFAWPPHIFWFIAIAIGFLGLMPWLAMIFGVSWFRVLARSVKSFSASRHANGSAMLWISLVLAICIAPFVPGFHPAGIAIACILAALLGKAFVNLPNIGNRFFFLLAALLLLAAGGILMGATIPDTRQLILTQAPLLEQVPGLAEKLAFISDPLRIMAAILLVAGLLSFFFVKRSRCCGGLIFGAIVTIALAQVGHLMLLPALSTMPGTPLVSYASIEQQTMAALAPPAPAAPVVIEEKPAPAPTQAAPAAPATPESLVSPEPAQPATPAEAPAAPKPAPEQPATTPAVEDTVTPQPDTATPAPSAAAGPADTATPQAAPETPAPAPEPAPAARPEAAPASEKAKTAEEPKAAE